jgi:hypothetical protein
MFIFAGGELMELIDYVKDAKIENGVVINNMVLRLVNTDVLFDYAGMNPAAARILDPRNLMAIQPTEILIDDKHATKQTANHELNEYQMLIDNPSLSYWEVHTALMKAANTTQNLSIDVTETKTMKKFERKSVSLITRKSAKGEDEVLITTPNFDRGCDRVTPTGGMIDNYQKNPVIMWLHDYKGETPAAGIPVAKCPYLRVTEEGIISGPPQFLEGDPFADRVKNAWNRGFIKTASIGFAPIEYETNEKGGTDYKKWELLEWSLVPIPMNAEAMRIAKDIGEDLIEKPIQPKQYTQAQLSDIIDELKCAVTNVGLSYDNEIELKRIILGITQELIIADAKAGGDIPVKNNTPPKNNGVQELITKILGK